MSSRVRRQLSQINGAGGGIFATTLLPVGTVILSERPLVDLPDNYARLPTNINRLKQGDKEAIQQFNYAPGYRPADDVPGPRRRRFWNCDDLAAKMTNNAFAVTVGRQERLYLFSEISRINHSCLPNVAVNWNRNAHSMELIALRDISAGTELTLDYAGPWDDWPDTEYRRGLLQANWHFACNCSVCTDPEQDDPDGPTRRRARLDHFYDLTRNNMAGWEVVRKLRNVETYVRDVEAELGGLRAVQGHRLPRILDHRLVHAYRMHAETLLETGDHARGLDAYARAHAVRCLLGGVLPNPDARAARAAFLASVGVDGFKRAFGASMQHAEG